MDTLCPGGLNRLSPAERTLADTLRSAGYTTGIFGKWHLGIAFQGCQPHERGFDQSMVFDPSIDYWGYSLNWDGQLQPGDGSYLTDKIATESTAFVRRHAAEPFFLYCAHFAPHQSRFGLQPPPPEIGQPYHAPREYVQRHLDRGLEEKLAQIYGMVDRLDVGVGQLLDELDRQGLTENTIVVFTSDNGAQPVTRRPDGCEMLDRFNCGMRGYKDLVYDGGLRVPAVVRWPAEIQGLRQVHRMAHFVDWMPTLLDAAAVKPVDAAPPLDGCSLLPLLRGEDVPAAGARFWQFSRYVPTPAFNAAARRDQWKLVRAPVPENRKWNQQDLRIHNDMESRAGHYALADTPSPDRLPDDLPEPGPSLLFNLAADPGETTNVAERHPEIISRLDSELSAWFEEVEWERREIYHHDGLHAPGETLVKVQKPE